MKTIPNKLFYEFGEFRLDTDKHRLLRDGEIVALTPKAVDALTILIQQRGKLVERDQLMNSVWRDTTVEPGNLDVTISRLRKALAENDRPESRATNALENTARRPKRKQRLRPDCSGIERW